MRDTKDCHYDVVVCGAGPSGFAAAVAASRAGARTAILERYAFCGGMATVGGVSVYINEHAGQRNLAGRIYNEFVDELIDSGAAYSVHTLRSWVVVNPEEIKAKCDRMLTESGVDIYYHLMLEGVALKGKTIESLTALGKSGVKYVFTAKVFIDCTGDADLAYMAGLETELGRPSDSAFQPMTMVYSVGPVDIEKASAGGAELINGKYLWWGDGNPALMGYIEKARKNSDWPIPKKCFSVLWSDPLTPNVISVNGTRITGFNGADSRSLSQAELAGRRQAAEAAVFMQKYLPGFEKAGLLKTGPQIGVRETRRVIGLYKLSEEDVLNCRQFDDQVAQAAYCIDVHLPNSEGTDLRKIPYGQGYGIPYRCLQTKVCLNYLVAGRALSASHIAASSARVMPICMTTGQAAGIAASIVVQKNVSLAQAYPGDQSLR